MNGTRIVHATTDLGLSKWNLLWLCCAILRNAATSHVIDGLFVGNLSLPIWHCYEPTTSLFQVQRQRTLETERPLSKMDGWILVQIWDNVRMHWKHRTKTWDLQGRNDDESFETDTGYAFHETLQTIFKPGCWRGRMVQLWQHFGLVA